MWTVVYIAANQKIAERIQQKLTAEGLLVKLRPIGQVQPDSVYSVEILVPESEVNEALDIINLG